jgi:hypothetical protein
VAWTDLLALAPCPILAAIVGSLSARAAAMRLLREQL